MAAANAAFRRRGSHPVRDILAFGPQPFVEWEQYPEGDVDDRVSGYGWYYHAHPLRGASVADEHGHFHLFCYPQLFADAEPLDAPAPGTEAYQDGICHLLAISLDMKGRPSAIFAVNRLSADQWIYPAAAMPRVIAGFQIGAGHVCEDVSAWIGAILRHQKNDIAALLADRDVALAASRGQRNETGGKHPLVFVSRPLSATPLI